MGVVKLVLSKIQKVIASHRNLVIKVDALKGHFFVPPLLLAYYSKFSYEKLVLTIDEHVIDIIFATLSHYKHVSLGSWTCLTGIYLPR